MTLKDVGPAAALFENNVATLDDWLNTPEDVELGGEMKRSLPGLIGDLEQAKTDAGGTVDGFIDGAATDIATPLRLAFDPTVIHSKVSLGVASDPNDDTQTLWKLVPNVGDHLLGHSANHHAGLKFSRVYAAPPGYYESPQYSNDTSKTVVQFVVANGGATSAQIDARLAEVGVGVPNFGLWAFCTYSHKIPVVLVPGVHPYSKLFCRFKNVAAGGGPAQAVDTFGGNANFALHDLEVYRI